ncbi:MAG: segregation/condensation protein A [Sandaracinaceae bacterium]|nr:segregation/condensation protein A [Sandaracinaceae bacterium]
MSEHDQPQITPIDASFQLDMPSFAGPLDLLLHLIQKHELNILDLPIAFVTEKYLAFLNLMEQLNLDVAAEYLLMAATLAHIKSKMLLPSPPTDQDDGISIEEEEDPREHLIKRLLEYQKYKLAAEGLGARSVQGRDVFLRGAETPEAEGQAPLAEVGLYKVARCVSVGAHASEDGPGSRNFRRARDHSGTHLANHDDSWIEEDHKVRRAFREHSDSLRAGRDVPRHFGNG